MEQAKDWPILNKAYKIGDGTHPESDSLPQCALMTRSSFKCSINCGQLNHLNTRWNETQTQF